MTMIWEFILISAFAEMHNQEIYILLSDCVSGISISFLAYITSHSMIKSILLVYMKTAF